VWSSVHPRSFLLDGKIPGNRGFAVLRTGRLVGK
jgi:hypothetical protein